VDWHVLSRNNYDYHKEKNLFSKQVKTFHNRLTN
jgi:hypothetical protein